MTDDCISLAELADRLGLSLFTLRRLIRSGELCLAPDRSDAVRRTDLEAFLRGRELPAWPPQHLPRPESS